MRSRFLPVLSLFAGFLVHDLLPHGTFGTYDVVARAAVTGAVTSVTCLLIFMPVKRRQR